MVLRRLKLTILRTARGLLVRHYIHALLPRRDEPSVSVFLYMYLLRAVASYASLGETQAVIGEGTGVRVRPDHLISQHAARGRW